MSDSRKYDVVVIGAGLNGLATAAYLAKAGKSVAVFEAADQVGGTMATVEIAPGFKAPAALDTVETLHPAVMDELGLKSYGLEIIEGGGTTVLLGSENAHQVNTDDPSIAELRRFTGRLGEALEKVWTRPLPAVEPTGVGGIVDLMRLGWALRSMGKRDFPEALRFLPMCVKDVMDEHVPDEATRAALSSSSLFGASMGPRSPGSAYGLVHHQPPCAGGVGGPVKFARGGPGAVTEALASSAKAAGVQVVLSSRVSEVIVEDGRAAGVSVNGESVRADRVVSALDPRTTLIDLVGPRWMEPEFVEKVLQVRSRGTITILRFALDKEPAFSGGAATLRGRIQIGSTVDYIERAWDAAKYRELPKEPLLTCSVPSALDPTLAPPGKHVMLVRAQFTPYQLDGTSWDAEREAFGDRVVHLLETHAPGFAKSILHSEVDSPVDLEARFGLSGGCLHHADLALDQLLHMRPIPGWYGYGMPVPGVYLCGPGTHPGGAGTGLSGRNAARQMLSDWK